ncbi:hypothetical protein GCM10010329_37320 [Streptomyces spiroverticillatus]|uniref:DUF418 domain-containing protein n=1 Tax=Streptomyces finlayi TaxID=67296 RepID=A0A918WYG4_9ACTN|nr:DUF418 domain-containing protein [Streptomyces finlayi]GHA10981.1 hypothetical protein GCM10010329_37320 [Streptomyces spiroverticillatus]GHC95234.1 hypothetical protein GCM10010334_34290 [Streptomyces finlayi]
MSTNDPTGIPGPAQRPPHPVTVQPAPPAGFGPHQPLAGGAPWPPHPPARDPLPALPAPRRIVEVDGLRGFALLGILLVNVLMMSGAVDIGGGAGAVAAGGPGAAEDVGGGVDSVVAWLVAFLVQGKFYLLFAFLFGYSFTVQMASAERSGARVVPRTLRRTAGLLVLGVLHAVLLFSGDILTAYGLLGLILLASRNASPRAARTAAYWVWGSFSALLLLMSALMALVPPTAADLAEGDADSAALAAAYRGSFGDVLGANLDQLPFVLLAAVLGTGTILPAFLFGLAAGRSGWFDRTDPAKLLRTVRIGLAVGVPTAALAATLELGAVRWSMLGSALGVLTAPALTAAYLAGMLLFFRTRPGRRVLAVLAPAGRMSLTNYLTQSLVMALVFTGYGFGLYGKLGVAVPVLMALVLYGVQLAVSGPLMRRHRHGPVEWLLRAVTLAGRPGGRSRQDVGQVNER